MKYWEYGSLSVTKNGRYLKNGERSFFWLGDTAWLLFAKLSEAEAYQYLRNRSEKGFNVIQAVLIHSMPKQKKGSLAVDGSFNVTDKEYWEHCRIIIEKAQELNLYVGLLPAWGSLVKEKILTPDNAEQYGDFLGQYFKEYPNIIWILGGDVRGDAGAEIFDVLANTLKKYNPERIITFHPFGRTSSADWFNDKKWLDINMFQSGHRRYDQASLNAWDDNGNDEEFFGEDNWKYVQREHSKAVLKPIVDGEPSYEGIPQGLHDKREPYWEAWDVRRYAYWSVFQGAAGHTYGDNAIMQFHRENEQGDYGVRESWQEALHHVGSNAMGYLSALMQSVDFEEGLPAEQLLRRRQKTGYYRIAVFAGKDFIFCYDYLGDEIPLNLSTYRGEFEAFWFNPEDGVYSFIQTVCEKRFLAKPVRRSGPGNDWVLVLKRKGYQRADEYKNK